MLCTQGQISYRMLCCFLQQMGNVTWILITAIAPDFEEELSLNDRFGHVIMFKFCGSDVFV